MVDREKVIGSLETAVKNFERYSGDEYGHEYDYARVEVDVLEDALALLKAQEPRVMTVEEVKAFEWDYCYLEQERQPGKEYRMIMGDYALTCITWPCITSMRIEYGDSSYGVKWRCWTSRPDEKRRAETPWN